MTVFASRSRTLPVVLLALGLLVAFDARAHDPGLSTLTLQLHPDRVDVRLELGAADADVLTFSEAGRPAALELLLDGVPHELPAVAVALDPDGGAERRWQLRAPTGRPLAVRFTGLDVLPAGHKQVVRVLDAGGALIGSRLVDARSPTPSFDRPAAASRLVRGRLAARELARWIGLGALHVAEGLDHVAFLLAILLGCARHRAVLRAVTAFTAAHSLTLGLATVGWLRLPGDVVEPLIAASIVWVALRNLGRAEGRGEPLAAIFLFGLVHGLGFAGQLVGLGVGRGGSLLLPLLGFNLGIELAQLAAVAAVLPLLAQLHRAPGGRMAVVRLGSLALALLGASWLAERLVS